MHIYSYLRTPGPCMSSCSGNSPFKSVSGSTKLKLGCLRAWLPGSWALYRSQDSYAPWRSGRDHAGTETSHTNEDSSLLNFFFSGLTFGKQRGEGRARTGPKQGLRPRTVPTARQTRQLQTGRGARSRGVALALRLRGGPWSKCRPRGYRWLARGAAAGPGGPEDLVAACPG